MTLATSGCSRHVVAFPPLVRGDLMDDTCSYTLDGSPLPAATYQIAAIWGAASPWASHLINIGFHAVNGWLAGTASPEPPPVSACAASVAAGRAFLLKPPMRGRVGRLGQPGRVDWMPA